MHIIIYNMVNNILYFNPSKELYSMQEVQDIIQKTFENEKTYLTKECDSNESLIKSTTNENKILHIIEKFI